MILLSFALLLISFLLLYRYRYWNHFILVVILLSFTVFIDLFVPSKKMNEIKIKDKEAIQLHLYIPENIEPGEKTKMVYSLHNGSPKSLDFKLTFDLSHPFFQILKESDSSDNKIYLSLDPEESQFSEVYIQAPPVHFKDFCINITLEKKQNEYKTIPPFTQSIQMSNIVASSWILVDSCKMVQINFGYPIKRWSWLLPFIPALFAFVLQYIKKS